MSPLHGDLLVNKLYSIIGLNMDLLAKKMVLTIQKIQKVLLTHKS
jgi:hypothetical protein